MRDGPLGSRGFAVPFIYQKSLSLPGYKLSFQVHWFDSCLGLLFFALPNYFMLVTMLDANTKTKCYSEDCFCPSHSMRRMHAKKSPPCVPAFILRAKCIAISRSHAFPDDSATEVRKLRKWKFRREVDFLYNRGLHNKPVSNCTRILKSNFRSTPKLIS